MRPRPKYSLQIQVEWSPSPYQNHTRRVPEPFFFFFLEKKIPEPNKKNKQKWLYVRPWDPTKPTNLNKYFKTAHESNNPTHPHLPSPSRVLHFCTSLSLSSSKCMSLITSLNDGILFWLQCTYTQTHITWKRKERAIGGVANCTRKCVV